MNAVGKNEKGFVLANKVVSTLDHKELMMVEPDVIDILTYSGESLIQLLALQIVQFVSVFY